MPTLKPLLIFGLRGTLVERIHARNVPEGMPAPDLTVGMVKVWLRPHMMQVLKDLQAHCRLAIWSSTTARNTHPLVSAVFESNAKLHAGTESETTMPDRSKLSATTSAKQEASSTSSLSAATEVSASVSNARSGRFDKKKRPAAVDAAVVGDIASAAKIDTFLPQRVHLEFVWTREHTRVDDFRRLNAIANEDSHATVKDLSQVFAHFPSIAQPQNTVLIDDTPSKAKTHACNFLWLDGCEALRIRDETGLVRLHEFVMKELLPAKDVRELLPRRIRI